MSLYPAQLLAQSPITVPFGTEVEVFTSNVNRTQTYNLICRSTIEITVRLKQGWTGTEWLAYQDITIPAGASQGAAKLHLLTILGTRASVALINASGDTNAVVDIELNERTE